MVILTCAILPSALGQVNLFKEVSLRPGNLLNLYSNHCFSNHSPLFFKTTSMVQLWIEELQWLSIFPNHILPSIGFRNELSLTVTDSTDVTDVNPFPNY